MENLTNLKIFCEGYRHGAQDLPTIDDWILWGGYDINFIGSEYSEHATKTDLYCVAYPANWTNQLPAPLHSFII